MRTKLILFIGGMALLAVFLFILTRKLTIDRSREEQKAIFALQVIARIGAVLDSEAERVAVLCQDWAAWDGMYDFVVRPDAQFLRESLPPTILEESRLNLVLVLDSRQKTVHWQGLDPDSGLANDFGWADSPVSHLSRGIRATFAAAASRRLLCDTPHGPLLLVSSPITRTDGSGPVIGRLVLGRHIGPDFAHTIGRALQERTELWFPRALGRTRWQSMLAPFAGWKYHFQESGGALTIDHLVRDSAGHDAFIVRVQAEKRIFFILQRASQTYFSLLLFGVLAAAGLFYIFIQRQMLGRLQRIARHMDGISGLHDLSARLGDSANDEISHLIRHIHRMQDRLQAEIARQQELEKNVLMNEKLVATGRLAANVAHEVNNPLFAISNAIQIIKKVLPGDQPEVNEVIGLAEREIRRVRHITRNLYNFTRIGVDEFREIDLLPVVHSAIQVLRWGRGLHGTRVVIRPPTGSFPLRGNSDSLQQVFMNLLLNASEAMAGGGQIDIELLPGVGVWEAHVRDEGPGFSAAMRERLFEPFNSSKDVKGVGLGLYISYQIVARHGGAIRLEEDGRPGAHVLVSLPRVTEERDGGG